MADEVGDHVEQRSRGDAGNVFLLASDTGLPRDSVANVTAVVTLNKADLAELAGVAPPVLMREIDRGLRGSLDLHSGAHDRR